MFDMLTKRVEGRRRMPGGYYNPFFSPKYSFYTRVSAGAYPLGVVVQPLTSGEVGKFGWDWNGDGVIDEYSNAATTHIYYDPGVYTIHSLLDTGSHVFESEKSAVVEVTNGFDVDDSKNWNCVDKENNDWHTAERLRVGDIKPRVCSRYNFYDLRVDDGVYKISVVPVGEKSKDGLKFTLLSEIGRVLAFSGGNGEYGYIVTHLNAGRYYVKVESNGYTEYLIKVDENIEDRPKTEESVGGILSLTGQDVYDVSPYGEFTNQRFLKIDEDEQEISIKLKVPEFDSDVDVYVVVAAVPGKDLAYLNSDGKFVKSATPYRAKVKSVDETTILSFPNMGNPLRNVRFYVGILPSGTPISALGNAKYIIQVVRP